MNWGLTIEKKLISIKECDKIDTSFHPKDYDEIVKPLIENGANINVQNKEGYTPLYLAVVLEHFKSAQLLLDAGADVNIKDNEEKSVLTIVTESDHKTALEFLRKNMLLKLVRDFFSSEVRL
jgi:ankyrin repeat protein